MIKILALLSVPILLAGCSLAPEYERPGLPVGSSFPETGATADSGVSGTLPGWRAFFEGLGLQELIQLALENNRDLRMAGLSVDRWAAIYQIQRSALIPTLDATADGLRQRTPGDLGITGEPTTRSTYYTAGLRIPAYELDFFGRVASLKDQALQQYLSTEEAFLSAQISLVSSVARQYLILVATREFLELAKRSLDVAEQSFELNRQSFDAGVGSELDLRTAEAQMLAYRADVTLFEERVAQAKNLLSMLVGVALPKTLPVTNSLEAVKVIEDLPAGLPSELLTRRPDIRSAEHALQAANAYIGVARAAFFPSVNLTAFGGSASSELSGLFGSGSGAWSFSPIVTVPIFAAGRNQANLDLARIEMEIEIAHYENVIQTAFREVADALAVRAAINGRVEAQQARVVAARRRQELSHLRFTSGVDNYLTVLLAQQEFNQAEQSLIEVRLARLTNLISLYAALGGGY